MTDILGQDKLLACRTHVPSKTARDAAMPRGSAGAIAGSSAAIRRGSLVGSGTPRRETADSTDVIRHATSSGFAAGTTSSAHVVRSFGLCGGEDGLARLADVESRTP